MVAEQGLSSLLFWGLRTTLSDPCVHVAVWVPKSLAKYPPQPDEIIDVAPMGRLRRSCSRPRYELALGVGRRPKLPCRKWRSKGPVS